MSFCRLLPSVHIFSHHAHLVVYLVSTFHITLLQTQGSQAEMYIALFNWCWILQADYKQIMLWMKLPWKMWSIILIYMMKDWKYVSFPSRPSCLYFIYETNVGVQDTIWKQNCFAAYAIQIKKKTEN
jgi:hypothetical protein